MNFANPEFLWLLLGIPILIFFKGKIGKTGSILFSSIAIAKEVAKFKRSKVGAFLMFLRLLAIALLIVALARLRLGKGYTEREESGIDIVLAVDVSGSMAALDLSENRTELLTRLDAVKKVIEDFIKKRPNDRIGMTIFASNPFVVSPLTLNHDWLLQNISRVEIGSIDGSSTAIGSAIATSVNRLRDLKDAKSRVIILLTDGDNNAGKISPIAAAEAAASFDTKIYIIAAGKSGRIPYAAANENGKIIRNKFGNPQIAGYGISQIDEASLKKIAEITGGKFYRASDYKNLQSIYNQIDALEKTEVKIHNFTEYNELFYYPLILALALLMLERLLANTKFRTLP